jgi:hypothetical protein
MRIAILLCLLEIPVFATSPGSWGDVPEEQVKVLTQLFESTGGENWKESSGWGSSTSPCEWFGIICNVNYADGKLRSSIVGISLTNNGLKGSIPSSLAKLPDLKFLNVALNEIKGEVPEEILIRWDNHEFEFQGGWNSFSNFAIRARLEYVASAVLCSQNEDVRFVLDIKESGPARFESIRCTPHTKRETHCLIREGESLGLGRFSRALKKLNYSSFKKEYSYPFTFTTHQAYIRTTVWWGDGSTNTVESYGGQGPIEVWMAQELFMALMENVSWEHEFTKPKCEAIQ